ncbi:hypothetical protein NEUTE1DRAFT_39374 [Neurospora tetrasperma FGSC 2508]|uniref:Uncharacterized protein n=1 Tax=Neurospora tetrasperma (strain FGSC 2508 / ATCC MYA-4615 / P0657) TaxID=510951 RepID=F8MGG2_NEUT8|nr:uncharacterized protein NEUTE1DRAFT_39374 [Neurospora tetrasperma FGSC 2508]EGO59434.1 hypothetical protein NEUTE1DRAFT_39374 [Neurospora tetrasperma FGSC 2508]EGZ73561.1 hypothetical protein NEUTE2DRAFT_62206 [Neurospora tetrasperma FGSC 2509]
MSFSNDYYGEWNALPSLALGNGYGAGYGDVYGYGYCNGNGDGGWNFAGNPGLDDHFNWDDWVTGNLRGYNSILDDSVIDTSVVDNSIIDNPIPSNSLNTAIDTSVIGERASLIDIFTDPVIGNMIPEFLLDPAIGTSAIGNWIPGNSVTNNSARVIWTSDNSATSNSARGSQIVRNPVGASPIVGTPVAGNSITGNWAFGNPVNGNQATANQSHVVANPVVGPSVTGRNPPTANAQYAPLMAAGKQAYVQGQSAIVAADVQAFAQIQAQAAAQAQGQATARQQTPSALMAAQRKRSATAQSQGMNGRLRQRAIAAAQAQAAARRAAGLVPAAPTTAPIPSPPFQPQGIFPFMKLPEELKLIIYRFVWHTTPDTSPSDQASYQHRLEFYSNPRHLRAQLRGLFKLGAISSAIRYVAYAEYFRSTQLYLRYDSHFRWNYSDSWHGSDKLTESMSLLWQDATLSPLLTEYVEHVAWHVGPVYRREQCDMQRAALDWLKNCKNVKTLEIVVAMRSAHVRPKDVKSLIQRKGRFASGKMPYSTFKYFRFFSWSINRLDVLRKKGRLEKVVISVEPFVNESTKVADRGTIDLKALLERSDWFQKFKRDTVKSLLAPKKQKIDTKSEKTQERSFYKIEQHLGHLNPCWHRSYRI